MRESASSGGVSSMTDGCIARTASRAVFFFQAEDGIRDVAVTGVQTCALPIYPAEVAALRRGAGILGGLLGELGEVLAGLGAPDDIGDLGPRAVLRLTAAGLGHARQHVRGVDAARLLELLRVLAVVLLHRGVRPGLEEVLGGERHGEDPASLGLPELVLMRAQVLPELVVARRRRGDERPELDQRPGRAGFL